MVDREVEHEFEYEQQQQHRLYVAEENDDGLSVISQDDDSSSWAPNLMSEEETWTESKELEISVKSNEEDGSEKRIKKYIVSYESKVIQENESTRRSREPSPSVSQGKCFDTLLKKIIIK